MARLGRYSFLAGMLIALVAGVTSLTWAPAALAVLGVVVGFLNITTEETTGFLLASVALMLSATALDEIPAVGEALAPFVANLVAFVGAAVFVVAVRTLLDIAPD
jgi:hypothetical protein